MSDKSPRQHLAKKQDKTIKEKRAERKAKASGAGSSDQVSRAAHGSSPRLQVGCLAFLGVGGVDVVGHQPVWGRRRRPPLVSDVQISVRGSAVVLG